MCTAPLNFWTVCLTLETILSAEYSVCFESQLFKGHPGKLAGDSVEKASVVFRYDKF